MNDTFQHKIEIKNGNRELSDMNALPFFLFYKVYNIIIVMMALSFVVVAVVE